MAARVGEPHSPAHDSPTKDGVFVAPEQYRDSPMCDFTLEQQWFRQFFVGILICVNNGACFILGIISPFMKEARFGYDQSQINIIASIGNLLSYFSLPNGYLYDRKGPQATLLVGSVLNVSGWIGMAAMFAGDGRPLLGGPVWLMCVFFGIAQFSASFYETGSVLTNLRAFSCYKGRVILIQKTFMGLGSSLVAQIYVAFFERTTDSIATFFLFLAVFSTVTGVLSVNYVALPSIGTWCLGLNVPDGATIARGGGESTMFDQPFNVGTVILIFAVAFVLVVSLIENFATELPTAARGAIGTITAALVISLTSMIAVTPSYSVNRGGFPVDVEEVSAAPVEAAEDGMLEAAASPTKRKLGSPVEGDAWEPSSPQRSHACEEEAPRYAGIAAEEEYIGAWHPAAAAAPREAGPAAATRSYGSGAIHHRPEQAAWPAPGPVIAEMPSEDADNGSPYPPIVLNGASLLVNLRHREMWVFWFICFASWGAMTLVSSNSSQIYQALAYEQFTMTGNTVYVSLYGAASAVGRVLVGAALPAMERRHIPVASFLVAAPVMNLIGLPLFLFVSPSMLFVPFFIVGFATGVSWGSTVLVVTAFFKTFNCGKHYSWLYTAGMLSPFAFNVLFFGPIYDRHSVDQGRLEDHSCKGTVCVATALLVCLAVNAAAVPCAVYFVRRTARLGGMRV